MPLTKINNRSLSGQVTNSQLPAGVGTILQHKVYHFHNSDPNNSHHTSVSTPGTGVGSGSGAWGRSGSLTTNSQTPIASEFQVNITPVASNSLFKIDMDYYCHPFIQNSANIRIVRTIAGGTPTVIWQPSTNTTSGFGMSYQDSAGANDHHTYFHIQTYDKPNTTSSVNYRAYYYVYSTSGSATHFFAYNGDSHWASPQHLTVQEIAQ